PFDTYGWYQVVETFLKNGFGTSNISILNPLWFLTLDAIAPVYSVLSAATGIAAVPVQSLPPIMNPQWGIPYVVDPLFLTLMKSPLILADASASVLLYMIFLMRGGIPAAEKAASLYFLNPLVIWVSSGWGQYDSLPAFFSALALYVIYAKRKSLTSGIGVLT